MSQAIKYTRTCAGDGIRSLSGSGIEVGSIVSDVDETLAAAPPAELSIAFTTANLQYAFMVADQDTEVLTNSASEPTDTISLKAGRPLEWSRGDGYFTCPFTADVTAIYVSPSVASRFKLRVLYN